MVYVWVKQVRTGYLSIGVARPDVDVESVQGYRTCRYWGAFSANGAILHGNIPTAEPPVDSTGNACQVGWYCTTWPGMRPFMAVGDTVGLLLDCTEGSLR